LASKDKEGEMVVENHGGQGFPFSVPRMVSVDCVITSFKFKSNLASSLRVPCLEFVVPVPVTGAGTRSLDALEKTEEVEVEVQVDVEVELETSPWPIC
jgi:hypothetical protein